MRPAESSTKNYKDVKSNKKNKTRNNKTSGAKPEAGVGCLAIFCEIIADLILKEEYENGKK